MATEAGPPTWEARWWSQPRWHRAIGHAMFWFWAALGVALPIAALICTLLHVRQGDVPDALRGGVVLFALVLTVGRSQLVGVGVGEEKILVRCVWPGWQEKTPLRAVRSARVKHLWLPLEPAGFLILHAGYLHWMLLPLASKYRPAIRVADWEGLVAALKEALEPLGKWRE